MSFPYLIQRCRRVDNSHKNGIDRVFDFDYMGSTEFEVGLFPAIRAMRAAKQEADKSKKTKWITRQITVANPRPAVAYYAGAPELISIAVELFEDQMKPLSERMHRLKERTGIQESYYPERSYTKPFDAWWAIDATPPFVLCTTREYAKDWLNAL